MRRVALAASALLPCLLAAAPAQAHPSLHNPLWVVVTGNRVHVRVAATLREVEIAASLPSGVVDGERLQRAIDAYPRYLLDHVRLSVGGARLEGRRARVLPPAEVDLANAAEHVRIRYDLDYDLPENAAGVLALEQDVLREYEYAPGQAWDVTYAVRFAAGQPKAKRDGLLRAGGALTFAVSPDAAPASSDAAPAPWPLAAAYVGHGLDHIRGGLDHLLFVAALALAAASLWDLLRVVGAFTLAHSLTLALALAVSGLVRLPPGLVEPAIAASIVFVAVQGARRASRPGLGARLLVVFGFGLVHGLGFAGGLLEAMQGLSGPPVAAAVLGFSAGVEVGHLAVVLPLWAAFRFLRRRLADRWAAALPRFASAAIALGGVYFLAIAASWAWPAMAAQRRVYLAPDNHTDFIWSASESQYAGSGGYFVQMLKYYLDRADATASKPAEVQSRFSTDGSYWLWIYERTQSAAEFQRLIDRIKDDHVSSPLSPLVATYGGQPAEGVLRGMYYPGRLERRFNLRFELAQAMENQTMPFGLGSLWSGSGAKYVWHGICACDTQVGGLGNRGREIYRWAGADGSDLLMKWHSLSGDNASIGGYAEARSPSAATAYVLNDAGFATRYPFPLVSGAFGQGWDDPVTKDQAIRDFAETHNASDPTTKVVVSNEADFFQDFEATYGSSPSLPSFSGSFGNEWDTYCASMAEVSARVKRAVEALRPAEALATLVSLKSPGFMSTRTAARDLAMMNVGLYYEHDFLNGGPGATGSERIAWQRRLANEVEGYVGPLLSDATTALGGLIASSGANARFYVFNPLGWSRTDVADFRYSGPAPGRVVDLATGQDVPWQIVTVGGLAYLRLQAPGVPAVGYKVFEIRPDAGTAFSNPFTVDAGTGLLDNGLYRLTVASRGAITSLVDRTRGDREFVRTIGGRAVNDLGAGSGTLSVENQGPVSVTLLADVTTSSPLKHRTRITLYRDSDRVDIRNEVLENFGNTQHTWGYGFEITSPEIRHEEVGAVLLAKLLSAGGDYSPVNARYDWLTLNHFADVSGAGSVGITLSNADAFFMRVGGSGVGTLDTATPQVSPLLGGLMTGLGGIAGQAGDSYFLQRFALRTHDGFDAPSAMRFAVQHQNPLVTGAVTGGSGYPETTYSLLAVSDPNVLLWALKPAEDGIAQGITARFWNLGSGASSFAVALTPGLQSAERTTHIETPLGTAPVAAGALNAAASARQIVTYRLHPPGLGGALQFIAARFSAPETAPRAVVTVKRSGATSGTVTVDYEASDGTATVDADYAPTAGTLTFGPGVTSRTLAVPLLADTRVEGDETVLLRLGNPGGGAELGAQATAILTITDDDRGGTLRFASAACKVSEAGPVAALSVTRTGGAASGVTVDYATVDGSATAGSDYTDTTGMLSFGAGAAKATFTVPITEDAFSEGDETFSVVLSGAAGGAGLDPPVSAVVTITEDEPTVQFPGAGASVKESAGRAVVTVRRSGPATGAATVDYQTSNGTATSPDDYTSSTGTLSFGPGVTSRTFAVPIVKDAIVEGDETVMLRVLNPTGVALGQQQTSVLTIQDDDVGGTLALSAAAYRAKETSPSALVAVRRSGGAAGDVRVSYATADGTAQAGTNYDATSGTLTFGPGVAARTFAVPLHDDGVPTDDLTVNLSLASPQGGAGLGAPTQAVLTIESASPLVEFGAASYSVGEAQGKAVITVKRSGPTAGTVTADYTTADGTATAPGDYTTTSGSLTFGPGVTTRTFAVPIVHDAAVEGDETALLRLTGAGSGAAVGEPSQAVLTIVSDSPKVQFSSAGYTVAEAAPKATIAVRRLPPTTGTVTVEYQTSDGAAHAGEDYTPASGTLTFSSGVVSRTFAVPIINDTVHEDGETVKVDLANAGGGAILGTPVSATLSIAANDAAGTLQFAAADSSAAEDGAFAVITVTRSGGVASDVTVAYATSDGTAVAGTDYEAASGTLVFGAGETSRTLVVPVLDDGLAGPNKTVHLTLSSPGGGGALGPRTTATLWIVDAH